jgi:hypothetical protein
MQSTKTLWLLDYCVGTWSNLIPIYAEDEQQAWVDAHCWAMQHNVVLPEDTILIHFPHGFTVHKCVLPGQVVENST